MAPAIGDATPCSGFAHVRSNSLNDRQPSPPETESARGAAGAVLSISSGWPGPQAPVWRMDAFRDRFLTAFGTAGTASQPPPLTADTVGVRVR